MERQELSGISAMASIASNLTLSSVLATLLAAKIEEETDHDKGYNSGITAAISVIKIYQTVLTAEMKAKANA